MQKRTTTGSEAIVWKVDDYYQEYTAYERYICLLEEFF